MRFSRLWLLVRFNLRRLGRDGAAALIVGVVVLVVAFAAVAVPRFVNRVSDDAVATAVTDANPRVRNMVIDQARRLPARSGDPFRLIRERGEEYSAQLPEALASIISDRYYLIDSQIFEVTQWPGAPGDPPAREVRFRYQEGIEQRIAFTEGLEPRPSVMVQVPLPDFSATRTLEMFEVAITRETADAFEIGVGDRIILEPQRQDPLTNGVPTRALQYQIVAEVSGIFEILRPDDEYWYDDEQLHHTSSRVDLANPDASIVAGTVLFSPDDYGRLFRVTQPVLWNIAYRFFVDVARFDAGDLGEISTALQEFQLSLGSGAFASLTEPRLSTGLEMVFAQFEAQRAVTIAVLSLAGAGLLALGLALIALLGSLTAGRRRVATLLQLGRGGTVGQLWSAQFAEGLILYLPVAVVGIIAARMAIEARESAVVTWSALAMGVAAAAVWSAMALPLMRRASTTGSTEEDLADTGSRRRWVLEGLIAVAGLGGLMLLRRRGLIAGAGASESSGLDPLLAAVPVLLALAVGMVALRVFPLFMRPGGWAASRFGDVVGFVALRRLRARSLPMQLPLPVTILAVGMAVFGVLLITSVDQTRSDRAWQATGAQVRLEPYTLDERLSPLLDLSTVEGIEASADATVFESRLATGPGLIPAVVRVLAIDMEDFSATVTGTPADPELPISVLRPLMASVDDAIPAVVSTDVISGIVVNPGDVLALRITSQIHVSILVEQIRPTFPAVDDGVDFVVLARDALDAAAPSADLRPSYRFLRGDPGLPDRVAEFFGTAGGVRVIAQSTLVAERAAAPLVGAVDDGYRLAVIAAAAFAVFAALASIALSSNERARDIAFLRTLGLTQREGGMLTFAEQVPWAVFAVASGVGFGMALAWLISPAIDVASFTGGEAAVDIAIGWAGMGMVAGGTLAAVLLAVAAYSWRFRRTGLTDVLRVGDQ